MDVWSNTLCLSFIFLLGNQFLWRLSIPQDRRHHLSCWKSRFCFLFFSFWRWKMPPLHPCSFGFWGDMVCKDFISSDNRLQKVSFSSYCGNNEWATPRLLVFVRQHLRNSMCAYFLITKSIYDRAISIIPILNVEAIFSIMVRRLFCTSVLALSSISSVAHVYGRRSRHVLSHFFFNLYSTYRRL